MPSTARPPVEFTGHKECGPEVRGGTMEEDAEAGITRSRGYAWQQTATMSDPRLEGTYWYSEDLDDLGADSVANGTLRIENEEGAWEGSAPYAYLSDGTVTTVTMVLTVEGAYEGLTVVGEFPFDDASCSSQIRGTIIEGEVPAIPEAYSPDEATAGESGPVAFSELRVADVVVPTSARAT